MSGLRRLVGGLAHRGSSTGLLTLIALLAVTATAAAPVYTQAARLSVMRASFLAGDGADQIETTTSSLGGGTSGLSSTVHQVLDNDLGAARVAHYFAADVLAESGQLSGPNDTLLTVATRTDVCAALRLAAGRCPTDTDEALVSTNATALPGFSLGAVVHFGGARALHIVGVYTVPDPNAPAWFAQGDTYFHPGTLDAVFTTPTTVAALVHANALSNVVLVDDLALVPDQMSIASLGPITHAVADLLASTTVSNDGDTPVSVIPATTAAVHQQWSALTVSVVIITSEVLALVWMLLFLVVTEDVEARGAEVALAKLRGLPRRRVLATAVSEPAAVLLIAVPIGVALGWLAGHLLAAAALPASPPVVLPSLAWAAAAVAVLGGIAAVGAASRRVLRRGVLDQWRRTSERGGARGWIFDAVLLTATAAGLVELIVSGSISSSSQGLQVELVPGLVGLAAAVVFSRLLPIGAKQLARATARRGGLGSFLALRHIARRPAGTRTTIVLATAVALAVFTVSAWDIGRTDRTYLATIDVGAPVVVSVAVPGTVDLATLVDRDDPSGHEAVAVENLTQGQGGETLLAVQPQRFAAVANWPHSVSHALLASLTQTLAPAVVTPVVLNGSALRYTVTGSAATLATTTFIAKVNGAGSAPAPVNDQVMTPLRAGGVAGAPSSSERLSGAIGNCPCDLLVINAENTQGGGGAGSVVISNLQQQVNGTWQPVPNAFTRAGGWQSSSSTVTATVMVADRADGTHWTFSTPPNGVAAIEVADFHDPLPVVGAAGYVGSAGAVIQGVGLDGSATLLDPVKVIAAVPGAPASGLVADLTQAQFEAGGTGTATEQVWLTAAGAKTVLPKLIAAGLVVVSTASSAAVHDGFDNQGPALADTVLLFDAGAATVLAAFGAALSLAAAARRRRYEYASLMVGGASRWTVWRALLLEQSLVLGFGTVVGVGAGILAVALAVSKVPILTVAPTAPALVYRPSTLVLLAAVALTVAVLAVLTLISSALLVRAVRTGTLRETAP